MRIFKKWRIFFVFVLIVATSITLMNKEVFISAFLNWIENYIFRCGDFGQYVSEVRDYSIEGIRLIDTMEAGKEPLLFIIISSLNRVAGFNSSQWYIIIFLLAKVLILLWTFLISKSITKSNGTALAICIILGLSIIDSRAWYVRQTLANMYLILLSFVFCLKLETSKAKWLPQMIILTGCLIAHKISFLYSLAWLSVIFLLSILKGDHALRNRTFYLIWLSFLLGLPYLYLFLWNFIDYMYEYTIRYWAIVTKSVEIVNWWSLNLSEWTAVIPGVHWRTLFNLFYYQPFLLLLPITILKKLFQLKDQKNNFTLAILTISIIHISLNIAFSNRMVILSNILIIISISFLSGNRRRKTLLLSLLVCLSAVSSLPLNLLGTGMLKNYATNVKNDPGTIFIKENINKEKSFFISDHCGTEYITQLGYKWYLNISQLTIYKQKELEAKWEATFEDWSGRINILTRSIFEKKFVPSKLKDMDLYIIYWPNFGSENQSQVKKIKNRDPQFFDNNHIELIYENLDKNSYINYIFKVDWNKLVYFDDVNYLDRTLKR